LHWFSGWQKDATVTFSIPGNFGGVTIGEPAADRRTAKAHRCAAPNPDWSLRRTVAIAVVVEKRR